MTKQEILDSLMGERDRLNADKVSIREQTSEMRDERESLAADSQRIERRRIALTNGIDSIELPRIAEIDNKVASLSRAINELLKQD